MEKLNYSITFVAKIENTEWDHFLWNVNINGENFEYKTGLGHFTPLYKPRKTGCLGAKNKRPENSMAIKGKNGFHSGWLHVPKIEEILNCLFMDSGSADISFYDFCQDFGYSDDSLKALDIYRACGDNARKLRKALGKDYTTTENYIESLEI